MAQTKYVELPLDDIDPCLIARMCAADEYSVNGDDVHVNMRLIMLRSDKEQFLDDMAAMFREYLENGFEDINADEVHRVADKYN